jgi:hypothetical protein
MTYAIPRNDGSFQYLEADTTLTFSIGAFSFPAGWLATSTHTDRAAHGILTVVDSGPPSGSFASINSGIQIVNGIPTLVYATIPLPTAQQILQGQAQIALLKSDVTILRCVEAQVQVPAAWHSYRIALRAIINGTDTTSITLPTPPSYPAGT